MICKEGSLDVISSSKSGGSHQHNHSMSMSLSSTSNGHNTLQHQRRKSQLITFGSSNAAASTNTTSSSCDIKNSVSHEIIVLNTSSNSNSNNSKRNSLLSNSSITAGHNGRLSFAEEDLVLITHGGGHARAQASLNNCSFGIKSGNGSISSAHEATDLDENVHNSYQHGVGEDIDVDDVFRRRSLEIDDDGVVIFDDIYGTHIDTKSNNANDDSGGGSYEDSHALHSSLGGSNRNSLEKDEDDDVDVISTDVSCYDQLLGSSCNTRNGDDDNELDNDDDDNDDIATLIGDGDGYATTKLAKNHKSNGMVNGFSAAQDDEGIAESGM